MPEPAADVNLASLVACDGRHGDGSLVGLHAGHSVTGTGQNPPPFFNGIASGCRSNAGNRVKPAWHFFEIVNSAYKIDFDFWENLRIHGAAWLYFPPLTKKVRGNPRSSVGSEFPIFEARVG